MKIGRMWRPLLACISLAIAFGMLQSGRALAAETAVFLRAFGPDGTEGSSFAGVRSVAVDQQTGNIYVLDSATGALYRFEPSGVPLAWGGSAGYISGNEISGLAPFTGDNESQVAVDSASDIVYVTEKSSIRAFHQDGEPAEFTAGPGFGTSEIPIGGELVGLAVDAHGNIYASDYAGTVRVFAASGEAITSFSVPAASGNLGVAPNGAVYVVNGGFGEEGGVHKFTPDEFPVTSTTTYSPGPVLAGLGFTYGVGVDPLNGDVYVLETNFLTSWIEKYDSSGTYIESSAKTGEEGDIPGIAQGVAVVGGGEEFQFYIGNTEAGRVEIFGEVIIPGPPSVASTSVSDVTSSSATLRAKINPNTFTTIYHFEYGLADCALGACASVPLGGSAIGNGHHAVRVIQHISGLLSNTTYHYRVVAENSHGQTSGPDRTFVTQSAAGGTQSADSRVWELVSPPEKAGGAPGRPLYSLIQASSSGEKLVYAATGSLTSDPAGNRAPEGNSILARREGGGSWSSIDLSPVHTEPAPLHASTEYKMFSPDLTKAVMEPRDNTKLSPETSEHTPYLWTDGDPPGFRPIATSTPPNATVTSGAPFGGEFSSEEPYTVSLAGATEALDHAVVRSTAPLLNGYPGTGGLYEWSSGELSPVSVLPQGEGADGGTLIEGLLGSGTGSLRHAISEDGNRVFWSSGAGGAKPNYQEGENENIITLGGLYVRDIQQNESFRLDEVRGGSGEGPARPAFQGASADGTVVFFTDSQHLTSNASSEGRDLYRCEVAAPASGEGCASLVDISVPLSSGESGEVYDLAPAISSNGGRVYFVASGVLDDAPGPEGEGAVGGQPNLYLWEEGIGVRFLARLSPADHLDWGVKLFGLKNGQGDNLAASSTADGHLFAFMSERSLTGYENRDPASEELMQEVFLYEAGANRIDCVSCDPFGSSPVGDPASKRHAVDPNALWRLRRTANVMPEPAKNNNAQEYSFHQPRAVLENGRVFFQSVDGLLPGDSNGQWDVYQWEPLGVGNCNVSAEGARVARSGSGCLSLISSGGAPGESAFLEASPTGDDVFFLTHGQLSILDVDTVNDVYDARVNGVEAVRPPISECAGESCQPSTEPPKDPTAASEQFNGPGNVHARNCPKGKQKVRRRGKARCVAKRHRGGHPKQRHANTSRGDRG